MKYIPLCLMLVLLAACGAQPATPRTGGVTPVFAFSEAVVGPNRVALGLIRGGTPLNDPGAKVRLKFYDLNDPSATVKLQADATYFGKGLPAAVYVAYPTFGQAGPWGVEVQVQLSDQSAPTVSKLKLEVVPTSGVPNVGQPAPTVKTLTLADVPDPAQLSSGANPDPALYRVSLDAALRSGKPTAVLFATPGFCRTSVCGPSVQVLAQLAKTYGDRVNFIHSEVYKYPFSQSFEALNQAADSAAKAGRQLTVDDFRTGYAEPMIAWGLATEPWLYLIDGQGTIVARYEGGITTEELGPALDKLVRG